MKCSACRARLGAYLDGELQNGAQVAVAAHLAECAACREFAESLRAVGVRLAQLQAIEPAADFTSTVMARIAALPAPQPSRLGRMWWVVAYLAAAWVLLAIAGMTRAFSWQSAVAAGGTFAARMSVALDAVYRVGQHFHLVSAVALAFGFEIALLIVAGVVGRNYISRVGATLLGARM